MASYKIRTNEDGSVELGTVTPASLAAYFNNAVIREIKLKDIDDYDENIVAKKNDVFIAPIKMFKILVFDDGELNTIASSMSRLREIFKDDSRIVEGFAFQNEMMLVIGVDYSKVLEDINMAIPNCECLFRPMSDYLEIAKPKCELELGRITAVSLAVFFNNALIKSVEPKTVHIGDERMIAKKNNTTIFTSYAFKIAVFDDFEMGKIARTISILKDIYGDSRIVEGFTFQNETIIVLGNDYEKMLEIWKGTLPGVDDYLGLE